MKILEKLLKIQSELKAPKNQHNSFGNYNYRNAEDILEALKPLLEKNGCTLNIKDEIIFVGTRYYVQSMATIKDVESGDSESSVAMARESEEKKGMDSAQVTGAASSYARKYALNGLFAIDDTKDPDSNELTKKTIKAATQGSKQETNAKLDIIRQKSEILKLSQDLGLEKGSDNIKVKIFIFSKVGLVLDEKNYVEIISRLQTLKQENNQKDNGTIAI